MVERRSAREAPRGPGNDGRCVDGVDLALDGVDLAPYRAIHAHAELELEAAGRGELQRLQELALRWERLTSDLPARPPDTAAPLLRSARQLQERTRIELIRLREALLVDISSGQRARRAADGYRAGPRRARLLDRSA